MGDPQRLLSNISDAEDLERELLGSIKRLDPPAGARAEAWTRLSAQIAVVGAVGTAAHGSAAAAAASGSAAGAAASGSAAAANIGASFGFKLLGSKAILGAALASVAVGASAVWVHLENERESAARLVPLGAASTPAPAQASRPVPEPAASSAVGPTLAPALPPTSDAAVARPNFKQSREDRLIGESALLTRARAELRSGNSAAAQQALDQLRAKFPKGVLGQEREVLSIEVLSARGNTEAARRRAKAFIAAYPKSPHSAQLSRFAEAP